MNSRGDFKTNHPLSAYVSWRIGGLAQFFYQPADLEDLASFLQNWREEPIIFLGFGTNVLIPDQGVKGLVVCLRDRLQKMQWLKEKNTLRCEAGVGLAQLIRYALIQGWHDSAFLVGIPGTLGGALAMNAGAYGDCIWNHVKAVETINRHGKIILRQPEEFKIAYREVLGANEEWFVAGYLNFNGDDPQRTKLAMREIMARRRASQPLNELSCGSVFRNPANDYAARLIEACGLKGYSIGGAQISSKHANFIVNKNAAKSVEVVELINFIQKRVLEKHGVNLSLEVKIFT